MIINKFFPEKGKLVLTANGKEFIERLGVETVRQVILAVLRGENIRTQTEPLTRRRVVLVTGAMIYLFIKGWAEVENFSENISKLAIEQIDNTPQSQKEIIWPAQWLIGLTNKGFQNVLRSNRENRLSYIEDFENAIKEASKRCKEDFGEIFLNFGYINNGELRKNITPLHWEDITRLSTAIGAATLTIRGSEKSTYGKLFERLIMGSVLTVLGFDHVENAQCKKLEKVFWLSDSSDIRECDATIRIRPGKIARFDIGFIGKGNPEIMKDKLTRFSREIEQNGQSYISNNFIIVDKMPDTSKTKDAARHSGTDIIQMSMQYWPLELATRLKTRFGYDSKILSIPEDLLNEYFEQRLKTIPILDFLNPNSILPIRKIREDQQSYSLQYDEDEENNDE